VSGDPVEAGPRPLNHGQQLAKDTFAYALARGLPAMVGLVILLAATRLLSREALGQYGLLVNVVLLVAAASSGWTQQAALRFYPAYERRGEAATFLAHHATAIAATLVVLVAIAGALYATAGGALGPYARLFGLAIAILVAVVAFYNVQFVLMARLASWSYSLMEIARGVLTLAFGLALLIYWRADVEALLVALLVALLLPLPFGAWKAGLLRPFGAARGSLDYTRAAFVYAFPLAGWFLGEQAFAAVDRLVIQYHRGAAEVGLFHAGYQALPELVTLSLAPLLMAAQPILVRAGETENREELESLIQRFTRYFLLITTPVAIGVAVAAPALSAVLLGAEFRDGHVVVPWIAAGFIGWNLGLFGNKRFEIERRTGVVFAILGTCVAANLVLAALLVPSHGFLGAAIASCIAFWLYPILVGIVPGSSIRWRFPWRTAANVAAAGGLAALAGLGAAGAFASAGHLAAGSAAIAAAFATFAAAVLLAGEVRRDEWGRARRSLAAVVRRPQT